MCELTFNHEGWLVCTSAWTAAAKPGEDVTLCYQWGLNRNSNLPYSTAHVRLRLTMEAFLDLTANQSRFDLRSYCR